MNLRGGPLEERDYQTLASRAIDRESADRSLVRRVTSIDGGEILGRNGAGDYSGLAIPYRWPGEDWVREYRIRRDHPEYENGKPKGKYMGPPGRGGMLYFPPDATPELLTDAAMPLVITEGEFKALALWRLAWHNLGESAERPRFLPVAIAGVWNWRGVIGKKNDESGHRVDEKGPIPDLSRLEWPSRSVIIAFDRDVETNEKVQIARSCFAKELHTRGAQVKFFEWPKDAPPSAKGVDDLVAAIGPDAVLSGIAQAQPAQQQSRYRTIENIPALRECNGRTVDYIREPELVRGSVVGLTGDSGSGKSTLACAWARDAGVPWLLLDRDNSISGISDRFDRLKILDAPNSRAWGGWLEEEAPQLDAPVVVEWVKRCGQVIVIADCLVSFHGGNENDAGEMRAFMRKPRRLADLGATVILIHHDGKADSAKDYRGSSDFKAAIDVGFHVSNFGSDGLLDKLVIRCFKSRFGLSGSLSYRYAGGLFVRGDSAEASQTVSEQLTAVLRMNPGVTASKFEDLANQKSLGRNRARSFLNDGVLAGSIRREGVRKNGNRYFLETSKDQNAE